MNPPLRVGLLTMLTGLLTGLLTAGVLEVCP